MNNPELDLQQTQDIVRQTSGNYEQFGFSGTVDSSIDNLYGELREYIQAPCEDKMGELADVLFYVIDIAVKEDYDLNLMMEYVFTKNMMRTNPEHVQAIMNETGLAGRELYNECKRRADNNTKTQSE